MQPGCVGMGEKVGGTRMASEIEAGDGEAKGGAAGVERRGRNDGFRAPLKRSFSVYFS